MQVYELLKSHHLNGFTFNAYSVNGTKLDKDITFYNYFDIQSLDIDYKSKQVNLKIIIGIDLDNLEYFYELEL